MNIKITNIFYIIKYSYEFYTNLWLPNLRYQPGCTPIFMNSITSNFNEKMLKLEIFTGHKAFCPVYTILELEFENLGGSTTGKIKIPADEVSMSFYSIMTHNL